ncbi:glyoxylate reductase/hydroxypyruvate reductase-like [Leptopilina heterotoma]|uniref:glyoxylate reductase/hydroxypyruvate reductase-like n=1 Tax=Leptopilina heterotoma TaxID=63436 RepID=UPI001CA7D2F9|nr:glyoxylate reductase/hydroxypyruvate reductase-like [Leptopilina heterotoma]
MVKPRILVISNDTPTVALDLLRTKCDLTIIPSPHPTREHVLRVVPEHDGIYLSSKVNVDSEMLNAAGPNLKVVCTMAAGYDHLDIPEIKRRGIKVGNTSEVSSSAVADIAVMLLLCAARRANEGRLKLIEGKVKKSPQWLLGVDVKGSTIGIVGFGNIGQAIAKRLKGFEIKNILYTGHSKKKAGDELGAEFVSLDELLEESDFVIAATPLTNETLKMFNDNTFGKMKKTAVFVNVGRGKVVDTDALVRAVENRTIFAAGLDVVDPEPLPRDHKLLKLANIEIMPHQGNATVKIRNSMATTAAQNLLNALEGKPMIYPL